MLLRNQVIGKIVDEAHEGQRSDMRQTARLRGGVGAKTGSMLSKTGTARPGVDRSPITTQRLAEEMWPGSAGEVDAG